MGKRETKRLLIIGKIPPPIGGVTIHVARLLKQLSNSSIPYDFSPLSKSLIFSLFREIKKYSCIHLHSSNPYVRLFISVLCKIYGVKSVITIHGDVGRFGFFKNQADKLAIKLSNCAITLNDNSYSIAKKLNNQAVMISAFIPPQIEEEFIPSATIEQIKSMKQKFDLIFCTNAFNKTFDKNGQEIYGIYELISVFLKFPQFGLVFSDPSGVYNESFQKDNIKLPSNIRIIKGTHSFYRVISLTDVHIRNTSTDGDSLSVKESLYLNKPTLVTDVVSRPKNCILFRRGEFEQLLQKISEGNLDLLEESVFNSEELDGSIALIRLYQNMI